GAGHEAGCSPLRGDPFDRQAQPLGHGQRRSVAILWAWTALLSAVAVYPTVTGSGDAFVLLGLAGCGLLLYTYFHPGLRR
ncbi:MAG: hypothetical protein ACO3DS_09665, partial [Phycisphaerales bacterium]